MNGMRAVEHALAPGVLHHALAVQHDHRPVAAVEHKQPVIRIDRDPADILQVPVIRQLRPPGLDLEPEVTGPNNGSHARPPGWLQLV
jgi:hypothetical protein